MATRYSSTLAWRIPWTEEPGRLLSIGLQKVGYDWSDLAHALSHTHIPWTEEPGRLLSIALQKVGYDWSDLAHALAHTHTHSKPYRDTQAHRLTHRDLMPDAGKMEMNLEVKWFCQDLLCSWELLPAWEELVLWFLLVFAVSPHWCQVRRNAPFVFWPNRDFNLGSHIQMAIGAQKSTLVNEMGQRSP